MGATAADAGGGGLVGGDRGKLRQELAGVDEEVGEGAVVVTEGPSTTLPFPFGKAKLRSG